MRRAHPYISQSRLLKCDILEHFSTHSQRKLVTVLQGGVGVGTSSQLMSRAATCTLFLWREITCVINSSPGWNELKGLSVAEGRKDP